MKFAINPFVRRQTADSPFSHYAGGIEDLAAKAELDFANQSPMDVVNKGGTIYIPDPRSLPDGDPPAPQFPTKTD